MSGEDGKVKEKVCCNTEFGEEEPSLAVELLVTAYLVGGGNPLTRNYCKREGERIRGCECCA